MPEWPNGIDSKSIVVAIPPRVRIPVSPPFIKPNLLIRLGFLFLCVFQYAIGYAITCWLRLHKSGFLWTGARASPLHYMRYENEQGNVLTQWLYNNSDHRWLTQLDTLLATSYHIPLHDYTPDTLAA